MHVHTCMAVLHVQPTRLPLRQLRDAIERRTGHGALRGGRCTWPQQAAHCAQQGGGLARGWGAPTERRRAEQPGGRHQAELPRAALAARAAPATSTLAAAAAAAAAALGLERLLERCPDIGQREAKGRLQPYDACCEGT